MSKMSKYPVQHFSRSFEGGWEGIEEKCYFLRLPPVSARKHVKHLHVHLPTPGVEVYNRNEDWMWQQARFAAETWTWPVDNLDTVGFHKLESLTVVMVIKKYSYQNIAGRFEDRGVKVWAEEWIEATKRQHNIPIVHLKFVEKYARARDRLEHIGRSFRRR